MQHDILIVDDEHDIRSQIAGVLADEGFAPRQAAGSREALHAVARRQPALVILDVWLAGSAHDGIQLLEMFKRDHPAMQIIMISAHGTLDMAVSATKKGAYDFISKPFKTDVLLHTIRRALSEARLRRENETLRRLAGADTPEELVGDSPEIRHIRRTIAELEDKDCRVCLTGAPGTGKGTVARLIHAASARRNGPFVIQNCNILKSRELETTLFGVEATKTTPRRIGALEKAHGGTLLLDEVGGLSPENQGHVARALHSRKFRRCDGELAIEVNVRILSTSSANLEGLVEKGLFRKDLFYLLNVMPLHIPPLAARRRDIAPLAEHFMQKSARLRECRSRVFSQGAIAALQAHDWSGNAWELSNVVERLLIQENGTAVGSINADAVLQAIGESDETFPVHGQASEFMGLPLREAREAFERDYLLFHLSRFEGNISRTAGFVGMDRAALHRKLKAMGISGSGNGAQGGFMASVVHPDPDPDPEPDAASAERPTVKPVPADRIPAGLSESAG